VKPPAEFTRLASDFGIEFEAGDVDRLGRYLDLMLETNRSFNLTSITDPEEAWTRHIFDSLTLLPYVSGAIESAGTNETRVLDVGSGAGLPGIPLAIALPAARVTLLEATGKKACFLERIRDELALGNVDIINERAELAGQNPNAHREKYDLVLSRAVGQLSTLLELTIPFARTGGLVLAIKGAKANEEVEHARQALHHLHSVVVDIRRTPTGRIVVIEKERPTPRAYPRPPGEPRRKPLS
jgi:16S rRNA (guanine527-N7)-methyltransferase